MPLAPITEVHHRQLRPLKRRNSSTPPQSDCEGVDTREAVADLPMWQCEKATVAGFAFGTPARVVTHLPAEQLGEVAAEGRQS